MKPVAAPLPQPTYVANYAAYIGIDWADEKHAVCLLVGDKLERTDLPHTAEDIGEWVSQLLRRFDGRPVAVALEQSQGGLVYALQQYPQLVLFLINPAKASAYREAFANSGKKDDPTDAELLARYTREHHPRLRAWRADDETTRELARHVELRRKIVEQRKHTMQRVVSTLKLYFPLALIIGKEYSENLMLALLSRWPTFREWQRAHPRTIDNLASRFVKSKERREQLVQSIREAKPLTTDPAIIRPNALYLKAHLAQLPALHQAIAEFDSQIANLFKSQPDAPIFRSPPGAGEALSPRLLVAFGTDRSRFETAQDVECYTGIAPVTKKSGKSCQVHRRFACNKFLRQSFHEFADHARKHCTWSKAFYDYKRKKGMHHHATVRALAYKWIRILFRCWKNRTPYDESKYLQQLRCKQVPYLPSTK